MGFELLEMNDDLYGLLNEVIRERDELIERLESCRMALDDMRAHCEEFKAEARRMHEERDDAIEYGDTEHEFAETLRQELDQARLCAEQMRDLYAAEVDESKKAFPWPWEVNDE